MHNFACAIHAFIHAAQCQKQRDPRLTYSSPQQHMNTPKLHATLDFARQCFSNFAHSLTRLSELVARARLAGDLIQFYQRDSTLSDRSLLTVRQLATCCLGSTLAALSYDTPKQPRLRVRRCRFLRWPLPLLGSSKQMRNAGNFRPSRSVRAPRGVNGLMGMGMVSGFAQIALALRRRFHPTHQLWHLRPRHRPAPQRSGHIVKPPQYVHTFQLINRSLVCFLSSAASSRIAFVAS